MLSRLTNELRRLQEPADMSLDVEAPRESPQQEDKKFMDNEDGNTTPASQRYSAAQNARQEQNSVRGTIFPSEEKIVLEGDTSGGLEQSQLDGHVSNEELHVVPPYSQDSPYESLEPWEIFSMDHPPPVPVYMLRTEEVVMPVVPGRTSPPWEVQSNIHDRSSRYAQYYSPPHGVRQYSPRPDYRGYSPFINQTPRRYSPESPYGARKAAGSVPDLYATRNSTPVSQLSFKPSYHPGTSPYASHSSGSLDLLSGSLVPNAGSPGPIRGRHRPGYPKNMNTEMIGIPLDASQTNIRQIRNNMPRSIQKRNPKLDRAELLGGAFQLPSGPVTSRRVVTGPARMEGNSGSRPPQHPSHHQYAQLHLETPRSGQPPLRYRSRDKYPPPNRIVSGSFDGSQDRIQIPSRPGTGSGGEQSGIHEHGMQYVNLVAREGPDYYLPFKPQINYRKPSPISPVLAARYLRRPTPPERPRAPEWDFQFQKTPELELQNPIGLTVPQTVEDDVRSNSIKSPRSVIQVIRSESSAGKSFKSSVAGKEFRKSLSILSGIVPSLKRTASVSSKGSKKSIKSLDLSGTCELRRDVSVSTKKATLKKNSQLEHPTLKTASKKSLNEEKRTEFYETHTATSMAGPSAGTIDEEPLETSFQTVELDHQPSTPSAEQGNSTPSWAFSHLLRRLPWMMHKRSSPTKARRATKSLSPTPSRFLNSNNENATADDNAGRCVGWWLEVGDGSQSPVPGIDSEDVSESAVTPKGRFAEMKAELRSLLVDRKPGRVLRKISSHVSAELRLVSSREGSIRERFFARPTFFSKENKHE